MSQHGVRLVNLSDRTGLVEKGTLTDPVRTDPTGVTAQPVTEAKATTGVVTSVAASASSVTLLASNASRKGALIYNDSSSDLRVKLGATASATSFTALLGAFTFWTVPPYTGIIDGIWDSATGSARITELT